MYAHIDIYIHRNYKKIIKNKIYTNKKKKETIKNKDILKKQ